METLDAVVIIGKNVPMISLILTTLAILSEVAYQLVAHKKQIIYFLHTARSWLLVATAFLLVAMVLAATLVGFWIGL